MFYVGLLSPILFKQFIHGIACSCRSFVFTIIQYSIFKQTIIYSFYCSWTFALSGFLSLFFAITNNAAHSYMFFCLMCVPKSRVAELQDMNVTYRSYLKQLYQVILPPASVSEFICSKSLPTFGIYSLNFYPFYPYCSVSL